MFRRGRREMREALKPREGKPGKWVVKEGKRYKVWVEDA
jgi:hypothetical protein